MDVMHTRAMWWCNAYMGDLQQLHLLF